MRLKKKHTESTLHPDDWIRVKTEWMDNIIMIKSKEIKRILQICFNPL